MEKKQAGTTVCGASDDLIAFDGDVNGEVGCYGTDEDDDGVLIMFSDGTMLEARYGKANMAIWSLVVLQAGSLYQKVTLCDDEDDDPHSDVVTFEPGLKWAYAATAWEKVQ